MPTSDIFKLKNIPLNDRVKAAFSLRESDLEANRAGQITQHQQERIKHRRADKTFSLVMGFCIAVFFMCSSFAVPGARGTALGCATLCGLMGLVPLGLLMLGNMTSDIQGDQVLSIQGPVSCISRWNTKKTTYCIALDTKRFDVSQEVFEGFMDGENYILYYTPSSQTLVGAEHIDS